MRVLVLFQWCLLSGPLTAPGRIGSTPFVAAGHQHLQSVGGLAHHAASAAVTVCERQRYLISACHVTCADTITGVTLSHWEVLGKVLVFCYAFSHTSQLRLVKSYDSEVGSEVWVSTSQTPQGKMSLVFALRLGHFVIAWQR